MIDIPIFFEYFELHINYILHRISINKLRFTFHDDNKGFDKYIFILSVVSYLNIDH